MTRLKKRRVARRNFVMKPLARPKHLVDAIAPFRAVHCLMGLRAFECPRGHPRYVLSLMYALLLIGLYWSTFYEMHQHYANVKFLKLEYVLHELLSHLTFFVVTYEIFVSWYHTKKLGACYRKISVIDETLRRLGTTIDYGEIYYATIGAMIGWFLYVLSLICLNLIMLQIRTNTQTAIRIIATYVYGMSVNWITILEFSVSVRCLQRRFELLNGLLSDGLLSTAAETEPVTLIEQNYVGGIVNAERRERAPVVSVLSRWNRRQSRRDFPPSEARNPTGSRFLPSRPSSRAQRQFRAELRSQSRGQVDGDQRRRKHLLQTVRQLHLELYKLSKTLCVCFGVRLSLEMGLSVIFITGVLYNLYVRLVLGQSTLNNLVEQTFIWILFAIAHVLKVVILNHLCKNAADEGNRTSEIIHAIHKRDTDVELREEILQFALQIAHGPVRFSAFGASMGYHILGSHLKNVTTYLVIMIQMSNSLESTSKQIGWARSD